MEVGEYMMPHFPCNTLPSRFSSLALTKACEENSFLSIANIYCSIRKKKKKFQQRRKNWAQRLLICSPIQRQEDGWKDLAHHAEHRSHPQGCLVPTLSQLLRWRNPSQLQQDLLIFQEKKNELKFYITQTFFPSPTWQTEICHLIFFSCHFFLVNKHLFLFFPFITFIPECELKPKVIERLAGNEVRTMPLQLCS